MKIFLTGGSGFVGGAFIKAHKDNHEIVAMSRSEKSDTILKKLGVTPIRSLLNSVEIKHLDGCEAVIHCAALVKDWGTWSEYEKVNVEGTRQLLEVAKKVGVKRFVHISTESTLFYGQHMHEVDETYPLALDAPYPYSRTKAQAEQLVSDANDEANGFTTIILRPRMIWGPNDQTIFDVVKEMAASGKFAWIDNGKAMTSSTHIENLVRAMDLGLTKGVAGNAYFILDDGVISIRDFLSKYLATGGVDLSKEKSLPGWFVRGLSHIIEFIWRGLRLKAEPPMSKFSVYIMCRDCILVDKKARTEMGYAPMISREEGFAALSKQ